MRERFLQTGLDGFQPHEIMELLLFYAIPQKNTNPLAHRLISEFGSVREVLAAPADALAAVEGMPPNAVTFFQLLRELFSVIVMQHQTEEHVPVTPDSLEQFFGKLFALERRETVYAAYLDEQLCIRECICIGEGHPSASAVFIRKMTEYAIRHGYNRIVIAHNHLCGTAAASSEDIAVTAAIAETLRALSITLSDHIIVGGGETVSLRQIGLLPQA